MEGKVKNILKKQKGITLVALVITIVILIILAVISINAIFGENGLIQRAQEGRKEHEKAEARERLEVVLADAYVEKKVSNEYTEEKFLRDHLDEYIYDQEPEAEVNGEEISLNGYTFALDRSVPELGDYIGEAGNLPPTIRKIEVTNKTLSEIAIEVTAVRAEGVEYRYSYKKQEEGEEEYKQVAEKAENTNTFTGLTSPEKYTIKVELIKDEEIVNKKEITVVLGELEKGTITFESAVWSRGTASVKITSNISGYSLQYQKNSVNNKWTLISNGQKVSGLLNNDILYVRLYDGKNASQYASIKIIDDIKPTIKYSLNTTNPVSDNVIITITANDNESGVSKIITPNNEEKKEGNNVSIQYTVTSNGEYTFNAIDKAGNLGNEIKVVVNNIIIKKEFNYTGSSQKFIVTKTAEYKIEVYGAQGQVGLSSYIQKGKRGQTVDMRQVL